MPSGTEIALQEANHIRLKVKGGLEPYVFRKRRLATLESVFNSAMIEEKFGSGRHEGPPRAR
jgi:hypothetical protein